MDPNKPNYAKINSMEHEIPQEALFNKANRYFKREGNITYFLDPVYREKLTPNQIPRCILEDERTAQGVNFLCNAGQGNRLRVHLILALHGKAKDFDDILRHCGDVLNRVKAVGIEADWLSDGSNMPTKPSEIVITDSDGRRQFQEAELGWLHDNHKIILPCEYEEIPQRTPLARGLVEAWGVFEEATERQDLDPTVRNELRAAAQASYQATRQPALLAQFGYWAHQLNQANLLNPEYDELALIVGSGHAHSQNRLRQSFGVSTEVHNVPHKDSGFEAYGATFTDMVANAQATDKQLQEIVPW